MSAVDLVLGLFLVSRMGSPFRRSGGDLLSRALRRSTIGAEAFHVRVREGIGCSILAMTARPSKRRLPLGLLAIVRERSTPVGLFFAISKAQAEPA